MLSFRHGSTLKKHQSDPLEHEYRFTYVLLLLSLVMSVFTW